MKPSFDLAVAYRIYPKIAKPALGLPFSHNKLQLADACLRSFRDSLGTLHAKIWVLLDGCPREFEDLFLHYFQPQQLVFVSLESVGNRATFDKQIDILLAQRDAELVYFAEDDYFYLPGEFHTMTDFLLAHDDVDFVTPYDHLDCYTLELHHGRKWIRVFADHHWRTAASTCLTFLTTRETLQQTARTFRSYGRNNFDASLWLSLTKEGIWNPLRLARYAVNNPWLAKIVVNTWLHGWRQIALAGRRRLWVPVPGIATHMDANALSPAIDWKTLMQEQAFANSAGEPQGSPTYSARH
jgi:hypothetical protein